jgi:hypothetical protein
MRNNIITLSGIVVGILLCASISVSVVRPALALVDASSSPDVTDSSTTVDSASSTDTIVPDSGIDAIVPGAASSTDEAVATSTEASAPAEQEASATPTSPPPAGLTEVHIIGTKYTDYFTDGTSLTSYPGDPAIDSHFSEPNAPIPTHEGLTWVHTVGQPLYDTPSGDLEVGDYAVQSDGSLIENAHFVSSTSTPEIISSPEVPPPTAPSSPDTSSSPPDSTPAGDSTENASAPSTDTSGENSASTTNLYSRIKDLFDDVGR